MTSEGGSAITHCPRCGSEGGSGARYCGACAFDFNALEGGASPGPAGPAPSRRTEGVRLIRRLLWTSIVAAMLATFLPVVGSTVAGASNPADCQPLSLGVSGPLTVTAAVGPCVSGNGQLYGGGFSVSIYLTGPSGYRHDFTHGGFLQVQVLPPTQVVVPTPGEYVLHVVTYEEVLPGCTPQEYCGQEHIGTSTAAVDLSPPAPPATPRPTPKPTPRPTPKPTPTVSAAPPTVSQAPSIALQSPTVSPSLASSVSDESATGASPTAAGASDAVTAAVAGGPSGNGSGSNGVLILIVIGFGLASVCLIALGLALEHRRRTGVGL